MSTRAHHRRLNRAPTGLFPAVPGVLADRTEEALATAFEEAYEVLPYVNRTNVYVTTFEPAEGLDKIREMFGEEAAEMIAGKLRQLPATATEPTVIIAHRANPDREQHRHERPHT